MAAKEQTDWQIFDQVGQHKYVSQSERLRFLEMADRQPVHVKALCYLMAYTGCRISEALALEDFHIDQDRGAIIFQTLKRRKRHFRCVPIPPFLVQMLVDAKSPGQSMLWPIAGWPCARCISGPAK